MQRVVRTFLAIEGSPEVRANAGRLITQLEATGAAVRWVKPELLHLTLKFLGDVELLEVPQICDIVTQAVAELPPFSVRVVGAGAFPNVQQPRTVWLGMEDPTGEIAALHEALEVALAPLGFRREARRFRPHLTIGRVRSLGGPGIAELRQILTAKQDLLAGVIDVDEVSVMSSELERHGPVYEPLATAPLNGQ